MNDNQYQNQYDSVTFEASETAQTASAGGSGEKGTSVGCCQKMMTACKDLCDRFMAARVGISYDITTCMMSGEGQGTAQGNHASTKKGQSQGGNIQAQQGSNTMTKQGELEIRVADLTIGAMVICAVMSVMCAVKGMCCGKTGCCKCKRKC